MKSSKEVNDELLSIAPALAKLKEQSPQDGFSVPPRYFRELETSVFDRVKPQPDASHSVWQVILHWIMVPPRPVLAMATCMLLVVAIWQLMPLPTEESILTASSEEDLESYVSSNLEAFSPEMILDVTQQTDDFDWELSLEDFSEEDIDNLLDEFINDISEQTLEDIL